MTKNTLFLLFFAVFATQLQAQTKLSGEVLDRAGLPIHGALVNFNSGQLHTVTDNSGKFTFALSDSLKNRSISVSFLGYKTKTMTINRGQEFVRVVLIENAISLNAVTVTASKHGHFSDYSAQTIQISSFDIVTNPSAMADIIGNMRALPGVQTNETDGRLIVQGGSPDESKYYINELIVANPYNLSATNSGVRSRFTSDLFEGIALQSGGFNAEFGQALSGIVNLNTKEQAKMDEKTDIQLSPIFAGMTQAGKGESYAFRANVMYNDMEFYNKLFPDAYDWKRPYRQLAADFFLNKEFSHKTKMTAQMNASSAGGEFMWCNVDSVPFINRMSESYFYAQVNVYHAMSQKFSLTAASNVVFNRLNATEVRYTGDKIETAGIWNHNKVNMQYSSGKLTNRTGAELIVNPYKRLYAVYGADYSAKIRNKLWSLYNDTKIFVGQNFTFSAGLRGEYSEYLNKLNFSPRLYAGYRLNGENTLSASVGKYYQLPDVEYLTMSRSLNFASATKGTLSYSYVNAKRGERLQFDAYYKSYNRLVTYAQGEFALENIAAAGKGYGYGADIFWKSNFRKMEYWLTYSFNNTQKRYAYFAQQVSPTYIAPHSFNVVLKYWIAPLKSLVGAAYNITASAPYYSEVAPYDKLGNTPLRNRLDVSWSFLPKQWIVVHLGCTNVLGTRNVYGYEYSQVTQGLRREITSPDKRFLLLGVFITLSHNKELNQLKDL
ncbi:MAG: TonB-dependent receptor [Cytophagaceae bacterium]|jgi:hypothetical protein|nr:TonB-dependent receptor [Cytophagaceae bacterium]